MTPPQPPTAEKPEFGNKRLIKLQEILSSHEKLMEFCAKIAEWGWERCSDAEGIEEDALEDFTEHILSE